MAVNFSEQSMWTPRYFTPGKILIGMLLRDKLILGEANLL